MYSEILTVGKPAFFLNEIIRKSIKNTTSLSLDLNHSYQASHKKMFKRHILIVSLVYVVVKGSNTRKLLFKQQQLFEFLNLEVDIDSFKTFEQAVYISYGETLKILKKELPLVYKYGKENLLSVDLLNHDISSFLRDLNSTGG